MIVAARRSVPVLIVVGKLVFLILIVAEETERLGWEVPYEEKRDIFSSDWPIAAYPGD